MDNVSTGGWLLISLAMLAIRIVPLVMLALVTGSLCGLFMRRISVKRGLLAGLRVAALGAAVVVVSMYLPPYPGFQWFETVVLLTTVAVTVFLCWRWNHRARGSEGQLT